MACNRANKTDLHHMVKRICCYDLINNELDIIFLNSNTYDGTNKHTTKEINFSMKKLDPLTSKVILYS